MTTEELLTAFNNAGLDTPHKVEMFLNGALAAVLKDQDGKMAEQRMKALQERHLARMKEISETKK